MNERGFNVRDLLLNRTIVKVCPEGSDGTEAAFANDIMLVLDDGMELTIYADRADAELAFSAVHRDNA